MNTTKNKILNALADCDLDCANWNDSTLNELVVVVLNALLDPTDEELLVPGEPYQVQKVVMVPRAEGIQRRREAWNKIVKHIITESF